MQVSENGAISFDSRVAAPPQATGPSLQSTASNMLLAAPFWTDYDLSQSGEVMYEVYEPDRLERRERLELVGGVIANLTEEGGGFEARWMILVEWRECQPSLSTNPGNLVRH